MDRNEEQNGRVQLEFMNKSQPMEWTAEITLPDYRSEISRLLWVRPTVMPPSRFVGGGKADFSGPVRYDILYTGPDGALYSAEHEEGYAFSVPFDSLSDFELREGVQVCAHPRMDAVISRVTGPRKLSVRCRMHADVRGYAVKNLTPRIKGEVGDEENIHRLCDGVENGRLFADGAEQFEVNDSFTPEGGEGELRLIASHGEVSMPDVAAAEGCLRCRGEAVITLLFCREGEGAARPFTAVRRIPFEREVAMDGVTPDCKGMVDGRVGEIRAVLDEGGVSLAAQVALAAEAESTESVLICRDMYLPGAQAECRFGEERFWEAACCGNRSFNISGEQAMSDLGLPPEAEVLDAMADAEIKEKSAEGNRGILNGEMHCRVLYAHAGEYGVVEMCVPFRTVLDDCGEDVMPLLQVPTCRVSVMRDRLRADAEVQMAVRTERHQTVRVLEEVTFTPTEPMPRQDFEICYPGERDTLWEVGKRYGISPADLAEANGLSYDALGDPGLLSDLPYLLIP